MKLLFAALASIALADSNGATAGNNRLSPADRKAKEDRLKLIRPDTCDVGKMECPRGKATCFCRDTKKDAVTGKQTRCVIDVAKMVAATGVDDPENWTSGKSFCREKLPKCSEREPKDDGKGCEGNRCLLAGKAGGKRQRCIGMPDKCQRIRTNDPTKTNRKCYTKHRIEINTNSATKAILCCKNCYKKQPRQPCLKDPFVHYRGVVALQKQGKKKVKTWSGTKNMVRSKIKMCCIQKYGSDGNLGETTEATFTTRTDDDGNQLDAAYLKVGSTGGNNDDGKAANNEAWSEAGNE